MTLNFTHFLSEAAIEDWEDGQRTTFADYVDETYLTALFHLFGNIQQAYLTAANATTEATIVAITTVVFFIVISTPTPFNLRRQAWRNQESSRRRMAA